MSSEHLASQSFEQTHQRGTSFGNNDRIDLRASGLESVEVQRARAEVAAATAVSPTQTLEKQVESQLEYVPLKQHEVIALLGRKVVFKLRKSYQEDNLDLENDEPLNYAFEPQTNKTAQYIVKKELHVAQETESIIEPSKNDVTDNDTKDQFDLAS